MSKHTTEIIDETDLREIVICGQRAYTIQRDVAAEITRLRAINAELLEALIALSNSCDTGKRGITESTKAPSLIELRAARAAIAKATS